MTSAASTGRTRDDSALGRRGKSKRVRFGRVAAGAGAGAGAAGAAAGGGVASAGRPPPLVFTAASRFTNRFLGLGNSNASPLRFWAVPPAAVIFSWAALAEPPGDHRQLFAAEVAVAQDFDRLAVVRHEAGLDQGGGVDRRARVEAGEFRPRSQRGTGGSKSWLLKPRSGGRGGRSASGRPRDPPSRTCAAAGRCACCRRGRTSCPARSTRRGPCAASSLFRGGGPVISCVMLMEYQSC